MLKTLAILAALLMFAGIGAFGQEAEPESTPEPTLDLTSEAPAETTAEATAEATAESDISTPAPVQYTRVRVGHYAVDAPHIDVYFDDRLVFRDVPYPATTNYLTLPAVATMITITEADESRDNPLVPPFSAVLLPDRAFTLAFSIAETTAEATPEPDAQAETAYQAPLIDETAVVGDGIPGSARVIVLNAIPATSMIATFGDNQPLIVQSGSRGILSLAPGESLLNVTLDSGATFENSLSFRSDLVYFIVVHGTPDAPIPSLQVSGTRTIAQLLRESPDFTLFYAMIESAGLVETFEIDAPFTVFAVSNTALEVYMSENGLMSDTLLSDTALVDALVRYHTARALMFSDTVASLALVPMLDGADIVVASDADGLLLNGGGRILIADVLATNGVIHVVDRVLIAPETEE